MSGTRKVTFTGGGGNFVSAEVSQKEVCRKRECLVEQNGAQSCNDPYNCGQDEPLGQVGHRFDTSREVVFHGKAIKVSDEDLYLPTFMVQLAAMAHIFIFLCAPIPSGSSSRHFAQFTWLGIDGSRPKPRFIGTTPQYLLSILDDPWLLSRP